MVNEYSITNTNVNASMKKQMKTFNACWFLQRNRSMVMYTDVAKITENLMKKSQFVNANIDLTSLLAHYVLTSGIFTDLKKNTSRKLKS